MLPADDPDRAVVLVCADGESRHPHLAVAGDTYTILLTGQDTAGRYCLIDMHVPPGGGPPPHRHDFEEMFSVLEGEITLTVRGQAKVARAGDTANVPANAPHAFVNASDAPARMLCLCAPAGQDEFFLAIGVPVAGRTTPPPLSDPATEAALRAKVAALAPRYRAEMLPP